jgi:hypothetical protein
MPQTISLSIKIDSPCHENWENMEPTEQGRFCNSCQKAVVDFTGLTDQQILQYFLKNPVPVCGRMLVSQKHRLYEHSTPKVKRNLAPIAASLLTLAAITAEAAPPAPLKWKISQVQLPGYKMAQPMPADSVIISGTVTNEKGVPLENVEIVFEHLKTSSDKDGNFEFTLPASLNRPAIIQFSYPLLNREVRNYHPLMGSTSYNITLLEPSKSHCYQVMGLMAPSFQMPLPFSTLYFQPSNSLDSKNRSFLRDLANFIKDNITEAFIIKPYYKSSKQRAVKISNLINTFLVDEEGINQDRIFQADPQLRKSNTTEVIIEFAPKERE